MGFKEKRETLVSLLESRGFIRTRGVKEAFLKVPREKFVLPEYREHAYSDDALPLLAGQTISQPSVIAVMTEALDVRNGQKVLEVGCGSGYQAALLAELDPDGKVYSVEVVPELARFASENLKKAGYSQVKVIVADGSEGLAEKAPFDRIIVTAACPNVPEPLISQLKTGGVLVAPVGARHYQDLMRLKKKKDGSVLVESLGFPVVFVPLKGKHGWQA